MAGLDSYVKLLLHFDGTDGSTTITDSELTPTKSVSVSGTAHLSTSSKKFGTASLLLDGNSDYVHTADSSDWYFGPDDFTIDTWVKLTNHTQRQGICGQEYSSDNNWAIYITVTSGNVHLAFDLWSGSSRIVYYLWDATNLKTLDGLWTHIEICRYGTTMYAFINGVSLSIMVSTPFGSQSFPNQSTDLTIGMSAPNANWYYLYGNIDEFRISKGIARHTANFTPSDTAYDQILYFNDSVTLSDYGAKNIELAKSDSITLSDSSNRKTGLNKTDLITLSDSFAKIFHYNKILVDSINISDNLNADMAGFIYRAFSDGILLVDSVINNVAKVFGDSFTTTDDIVKSTLLALSDSFTLSDSCGRNTTVKLVNNNTVNFQITNSTSSDFITPYFGTVAGVPIYGNGYFTENIISIENPFPLSFVGIGSITNISIYVESDYISFLDQTELLPIWQMLLVLYATFMGLFKDKRYNASRMVEAIYRGELAYLKQLIEVKPDSKSDWTYK